ncbi:helix-turn-helix domain-containing protein [Intestinibacter bartlettii]|uniref:helix-turn-helix domain-containing protein n=1 Tax=Intestinibacter bartlettii TaxID=261299 RepID=UPI00321A3E32
MRKKVNSMMVDFDIKELEEDINNFDEYESKLFEAKQIEREFIMGLIRLRKEQKITQKELAKRTGLTQQVISNVEKMDRKPTLPNLIRYLLGLGININDLLLTKNN